MTPENFDRGIALAAARRLEEEVAELIDALQHASRAAILDELADVRYYTHVVTDVALLTCELVARYGRVKSTLRQAGLRQKQLELQLAETLVANLT